MEELKYSEVETKSFESSSSNNILELCDTQYESIENITDFYHKFRQIVCSSLKRKGFIDGGEMLLEDEIISPTFEEVIILWCLDKVRPNLSAKVKPAFNNQLNNGHSIKELKDDIFHHFSNKNGLDDTELNLKVEKSKDSKKSEKVVTKEDPEEEKSVAEDSFLKPDIDISIKEESEFAEDMNDEDSMFADNAEYDVDMDFNSADDNFEDDDSKGKRKRRGRNKPYSKITKFNMPTECDICGRVCAGERRLNEHIQRKHKTTFTCKTCNQVFNSSQELKAHRTEAHKPEIKREVCPYCGKMIRTLFKRRHLLTHTSDIVCKICREKFVTQEELDVHTQKHEENPNYRSSRKKNIKCDTCKRGFANVQEYGHHICKHYGCELCEERFMIKRNLDVHKKFHVGEQIFSCDLCEALFLKRKALYCHKRSTHDPEAKKYKCDVCGKSFLNRRELESHIGIHSSERTYKCDVCPKSFKQKAGLRVHKQVHTGNIPYINCVTCDMQFRNASLMKTHRESGECERKMESLAAERLIAERLAAESLLAAATQTKIES